MIRMASEVFEEKPYYTNLIAELCEACLIVLGCGSRSRNEVCFYMLNIVDQKWVYQVRRLVRMTWTISEVLKGK